MGEQSIRRRAFFAKHPLCAFCGGKQSATTVEHCPPRSLFVGKEWPEGFEFPACAKCNNGSSDDDLLVAFFKRSCEDGDPSNTGVLGLMKQINRQFPGIAQRMIPDAVAAGSYLRRHDIRLSPTFSEGDSPLVLIPDEMRSAVRVFAAKLAKAVYYKDVGKIFPSDGCLALMWFTNTDLARHGTYPVFESLRGLAGEIPKLSRNGKYLNDQFEYKLSAGQEEGPFLLQAAFGVAFGLVVFGGTQSTFLRTTVAELTAQYGTGKAGRLELLQGFE